MALERSSTQDSFFEVLERVLEKGIVIDAAVQISVAGLEVLRVDAWVVVASIETYLRHDDLVRKIVMGDTQPPLSLEAGLEPPGAESIVEPEAAQEAAPQQDAPVDPEPEPPPEP